MLLEPKEAVVVDEFEEPVVPIPDVVGVVPPLVPLVPAAESVPSVLDGSPCVVGTPAPLAVVAPSAELAPTVGPTGAEAGRSVPSWGCPESLDGADPSDEPEAGRSPTADSVAESSPLSSEVSAPRVLSTNPPTAKPMTSTPTTTRVDKPLSPTHSPTWSIASRPRRLTDTRLTLHRFCIAPPGSLQPGSGFRSRNVIFAQRRAPPPTQPGCGDGPLRT